MHQRRSRHNSTCPAPGSLTRSEKRFRARARLIAEMAQRAGILVPSPCQVCGATKRIEKHHPDYRFPLEVTWLCRKDHAREHARMRAWWGEILDTLRLRRGTPGLHGLDTGAMMSVEPTLADQQHRD